MADWDPDSKLIVVVGIAIILPILIGLIVIDIARLLT